MTCFKMELSSYDYNKEHYFPVSQFLIMYYTLLTSSIPVVAIMILMDFVNNIMALSLYRNVYYICVIIIYSMSAQLKPVTYTCIGYTDIKLSI